MQIIDNGIETLARKIQQHQNSDHIDFLKVRLGIQIVAINFFKAIVTYGLALLLNTILYTLTVHVSYIFVRRFSHGAHAKSSLLCHIQNILLFVLVPFAIARFTIPFHYMFALGVIGWLIVIKYAPAATRKQPIKASRRRGLKVKSIIVTAIVLIIALVVPAPYQQLICFGVALQATTLLPIFFPKEAD
ncbi:accessory regulator AgrB [Staphylococcus muscae]|uniref:Accessory gene regulator protein B n=1 Tax=Staphylococcus muscae TaxID=1294 RepID=A0A240C5A7_9STAP|nr:accessory gene regulator AgrB [Staphylococcus muscae]AVQ33461.1 accessory regulator AgrB [Staphylococcus muscae]PNZ01066.1 accessory regulator AgrB [Staphylococcus muscae]GGA90392.1 accessory gene regulator protein B [Staphylococcus muscae]SNW03301.1 accessory gene regulator protein B [Staphylococcus muscae]